MPENVQPKDIQDLWTLSQKDVGAIVKRLTDQFLHGPPGQCIANKKNLKELLDKLEEYTEDVSLAAQLGLGPTENIITSTTDPFAPSTWMPGPSQWTKDYSNWISRLDTYQTTVDNAKYEAGPDSCEELRPVTEALLVGWYQPGTPGIANPQVQTIPDVVTPFMLGNQVTTSQDWQWKRLDLLVNDIIERIKIVIPVFNPNIDLSSLVKYLVAGGVVLVALALIGRRQANSWRTYR